MYVSAGTMKQLIATVKHMHVYKEEEEKTFACIAVVLYYNSSQLL